MLLFSLWQSFFFLVFLATNWCLFFSINLRLLCNYLWSLKYISHYSCFGKKRFSHRFIPNTCSLNFAISGLENLSINLLNKFFYFYVLSAQVLIQTVSFIFILSFLFVCAKHPLIPSLFMCVSALFLSSLRPQIHLLVCFVFELSIITAFSSSYFFAWGCYPLMTLYLSSACHMIILFPCVSLSYD